MKKLLQISLFFYAFVLSAKHSWVYQAYHAGDLETARKHSLEMLTTKSDDFQINYNLGNVLYKEAKYQDAANSFARVHGKMESKALFNKGNCHYQMQDYAAAIEAYEKALAIDPDDKKTEHNLELARKRLEQETEQNNQNQDQPDQNQDQNNDTNQDQNQENDSKSNQKNNQSDKNNSEQKSNQANDSENNGDDQKNDQQQSDQSKDNASNNEQNKQDQDESADDASEQSQNQKTNDQKKEKGNRSNSQNVSNDQLKNELEKGKPESPQPKHDPAQKEEFDQDKKSESEKNIIAQALSDGKKNTLMDSLSNDERLEEGLQGLIEKLEREEKHIQGALTRMAVHKSGGKQNDKNNW
jgi:Ca-activated chloride channel family protein